MAPVSASAVEHHAIHRISGILQETENNKRLAVSIVVLASLVLFFIFIGVYLLVIRRRRLRRAASDADAEDCVGQNNLEHHACLDTWNATVGEYAYEGQAEKKIVRELVTSKPRVRSITDSRPSSLSEMEADRIRFLTFKFPPVQDRVEDDSHVASRTVSASEIQRTRDNHIAVQSAEVVPSPTLETCPVKETRSRTRHDVDRGESALKRLDAIIAQEPSFVVPEVLKSLPPAAVDSMRHVRVMDMLDDILAQEPPPLSPVSELSDSSDSASPVVSTNHSKNLPPVDLVYLQQLRDETQMIVLLEAKPRTTQRYLVQPTLNTWSKLTGQGNVPLVSHPAIVVEDTGLGELPMQSPADISLLDLDTSPTMDYLTPSWNVTILDDDEEDEEEPVYVPPRIVKTVPVRPFSPFVKPRRSQLGRVTPRPVIGRSIGPGLGLSIIPELAFDEEVEVAEPTIPLRAVFAARPAHKTAVQYDYF